MAESQTTDDPKPSMSRDAARRIANRIAYELDIIREEGHQDDPGGWYAMDRFAAIAEVAQAAAGCNSLAYAISIDESVPQDYWDNGGAWNASHDCCADIETAVAAPGSPAHPTVPVQVWADVDVGIAEMVRRLNALPGIRTVASCQGGPYRPYVMVTWEDDAALARLAGCPMTPIGKHHAYMHPWEK